VISPTQKSLLDNAQNSQKTYNHASGGVRTSFSFKQTTADVHFIPALVYVELHKKCFPPECVRFKYHNLNLLCNICLGHIFEVKI